MGLLHWLGLKRGDEYPNLDALLRELRRALPNDESVVLRYMAVVVVLLGKVACVDGRLTDAEEKTVRDLLSHIDRLSPTAIDAVCSALAGKVLSVTDEEVALCFRELRALCDRGERLEVMRLLTKMAAVDGKLSPEETTELRAIADGIGVPPEAFEVLEHEALSAAK